MDRSVSTDIELEAGHYSVLMKITAIRNSNRLTPEEVVRRCAKDRREKLVQIGLSYDLAHAKGRVLESEKEKLEHEQREQRKKAAERKKLREQLEKQKRKEWLRAKKFAARQKRANLKIERLEAKRRSLAGGGRGDAPSMSAHDGSADGNDDGMKKNTETEPLLEAGSAPLDEEPTPNAPPSPPQEVIERQGPVVESLEKFLARHEDDASNDDATKPVPEIRVNGVATPSNAPTPPSQPGPPPPTLATTPDLRDGTSEDSDEDSFRSFEFDSDLDMPSEEDEPVALKVAPALSDGPPDEFECDPWNAVCVVGLRVYSMDAELSLQVVRPKNLDEGEAPLDRDDPAKAAAAKTADSVKDVGAVPVEVNGKE
jgi:hypothetical protein